jgi:hypothetical protein
MWWRCRILNLAFADAAGSVNEASTVDTSVNGDAVAFSSAENMNQAVVVPNGRDGIMEKKHASRQPRREKIETTVPPDCTTEITIIHITSVLLLTPIKIGMLQ